MSSSELLDRFVLLMTWIPDVSVKLQRGFTVPHAIRDLSVEPIYAIPQRILDHLKSRLPEFLTVSELANERRFTEYCRSVYALGIYCGIFVHHSVLTNETAHIVEEDIFHELGWGQYATSAALNQSIKVAAERSFPVEQQLEGYRGWLLTDPLFLEERDVLKSKWNATISRIGIFPTLAPIRQIESLSSQDSMNSVDATVLVAEFTAFYRRWQLSQLATWDLPQPIGANLGCPASIGKSIGVEDSPTIQLPPTIRLPARFPTSELIQGHPKDHLAGWKSVLDCRHPQNYGIERFGRIFQLHFYRNIVLASRYGDRFKRQQGALDTVFRHFFGDKSDDSVRPLRQWIDRRLKTQTGARAVSLE